MHEISSCSVVGTEFFTFDRDGDDRDFRAMMFGETSEGGNELWSSMMFMFFMLLILISFII